MRVTREQYYAGGGICTLHMLPNEQGGRTNHAVTLPVLCALHQCLVVADSSVVSQWAAGLFQGLHASIVKAFLADLAANQFIQNRGDCVQLTLVQGVPLECDIHECFTFE